LYILNVIKTRIISSSEKEENKLMMTTKICLLKTQRVVWIMMVIEKGAIRVGRDEPYIGEEQVEDLTLMYQM
jgi:hypothetical protein